MNTTFQSFKAAVIHFGALTQYLFPFGNFIVPAVLWAIFKNENAELDNHGKRVLNFQISLWLYSAVLFAVAIPLIISQFPAISVSELYYNDWETFIRTFNWSSLGGIFLLIVCLIGICAFMHISGFILVIIGGIRALNNQSFSYPLNIPFLSYSTIDSVENPEIVQEKSA